MSYPNLENFNDIPSRIAAGIQEPTMQGYSLKSIGRPIYSNGAMWRIRCPRCGGTGRLDSTGWAKLKGDKKVPHRKDCWPCKANGFMKVPSIERYQVMCLTWCYYRIHQGREHEILNMGRSEWEYCDKMTNDGDDYYAMMRAFWGNILNNLEAIVAGHMTHPYTEVAQRAVDRWLTPKYGAFQVWVDMGWDENFVSWFANMMEE